MNLYDTRRRLKTTFSAGVNASSSDEMTPLQQLKAIRKYLHQEKNFWSVILMKSQVN